MQHFISFMALLLCFDVTGISWSQVMRWIYPVSPHMTKAPVLQTVTLTNLPADIKPPVLVTVHLVREQTGKTITVLSKVTIWDTWLDQKSGGPRSPNRWRKTDVRFYRTIVNSSYPRRWPGSDGVKFPALPRGSLQSVTVNLNIQCHTTE